MPNDDAILATHTLIREGQRPVRRMRAYTLTIKPKGGAARTVRIDSPRVRIGSQKGNEIVLDDSAVSRAHLEIEADDRGFRARDLESTNGTFVDGYRALDMYLKPGSIVKLGTTELRFDPTAEERDVPALDDDRFGPLVGSSTAMRELFATLEKASPTDATILIEGETGTGKELVAQAIHGRSGRAGGPLVVFDCAGVASNLIESELFGHEKGAFTGATDKRVGRLEEADGGTLFIDELGELPLDLQPKLLRVLERREVRRLGGTQTRAVDVRIVAATNRDLAKEVNRGGFREDLYYRLAVVRVTLPALRDRRDDIPLLVASFIRRALANDSARAETILRSIREENWERLRTHPWPGNVRELRNVIERTLALSGGGGVDAIDPPTMAGRVAPPRSSSGEASPKAEVDLDRPFTDLKGEVLAQFEERYLTEQLAKHGGNFSRAAAASGLDRMYFKRLIKKYRE